jgi:hypothetical protein
MGLIINLRNEPLATVLRSRETLHRTAVRATGMVFLRMKSRAPVWTILDNVRVAREGASMF